MSCPGSTFTCLASSSSPPPFSQTGKIPRHSAQVAGTPLQSTEPHGVPTPWGPHTPHCGAGPRHGRPRTHSCQTIPDVVCACDVKVIPPNLPINLSLEEADTFPCWPHLPLRDRSMSDTEHMYFVFSQNGDRQKFTGGQVALLAREDASVKVRTNLPILAMLLPSVSTS